MVMMVRVRVRMAVRIGGFGVRMRSRNRRGSRVRRYGCWGGIYSGRHVAFDAFVSTVRRQSA
jgi:hypothetical protein